MPEVSLVLGNEEKLSARVWQAQRGCRGRTGRHCGGREIRVNDIMAVRETAAHLIDGFEGRARAFVQVQNGCDHRCTFCIIPFGRGNSRSVPIGEVVAQIRRLCFQGFREVVLTGVDLNRLRIEPAGNARARRAGEENSQARARARAAAGGRPSIPSRWIGSCSMPSRTRPGSCRICTSRSKPGTISS